MYTDRKIPVEKFVSEKRTVLIKDRREAKIYAEQVRSYPYPIYDVDGYRVAFGIPK